MHVRAAGPEDAASLSELLNAVIAEGGRTAITTPLSADELAEWFITGPHCASCVVAVGDTEERLGFQALERFHEDLPVGAADIATFVSADARGQGVGRALARATVRLAEQAGLTSLRAVIRRQNGGAIRYYRSLGFDDEGGRLTGETITVWRPVPAVSDRWGM
ncbi:GNAT family N-acetyltransferase [Isoptericola sp. NPDC019482]|uniref:GNAT family N-acetyltransferase n=1 Tax=Isoptericola sp. NPDC019482 TaxID=3154688 RepID=UPI0034705013